MEIKQYEIQYSSTRDVVWVHCSDGSTVGRFNVRTGIDIHNCVNDQLTGAPQCLLCTHSKPTEQDRQTFSLKASELWGVEIDWSKIDFQ